MSLGPLPLLHIGPMSAPMPQTPLDGDLSAPAGGFQPGSLDCSASTSSSDGLEDRTSIHSCSGSPLCRICFQGPEQGELLSPCRCSGSVRCVHKSCLIKWVSQRGYWSCELCYYKYHVVRISTKNPLQWQRISVTRLEMVQLFAAVLGVLFLVFSFSWLIWSLVSDHGRWQPQDVLFYACYAMYMFMDVVSIGLIFHVGPSVFRIFHRWKMLNQRWKVFNYDRARDQQDQRLLAMLPAEPHPGPPPPFSSPSAGATAVPHLEGGVPAWASPSFTLAAERNRGNRWTGRLFLLLGRGTPPPPLPPELVTTVTAV